MIKYLRIAALAGFSAIICSACNMPQQHYSVTPAFYYWKSQAVFNATEQNTLEQNAGKLYVKFFDVVWDAKNSSAVPVAKIQFADSSRKWLFARQTEIVPTVFITNESILLTDSPAIMNLAQQIAGLIENTKNIQLAAAMIREIQIDCDWTAGSRDRYFLLLQHLKQHPYFRDKLLSATIRLYQCKYKLKAGIPPVDRGLLMCYNMGNLKNPFTKNSILDPEELKQYTGNLDVYPLDLDIALPLFNWKVLFRNNEYKGLIQDLPAEMLNHSSIANRKDNTYRLLKDTVLMGYDLRKDDMIRQEDSNFDDILKAAGILKSKIRNRQLTLALYHLDSITLHNFSTHEIQTIFSSLH